MERWRRVSVVALLLLLLSACHGKELSVESQDQSLVYDHTLAKTLVEYASANWIEDLIWKQLDLSYPNMPNAKVHSGFFSSYNNTILRVAITSAVRNARNTYGDINVIVTGHSMGGAMAAFCALDLSISLGSKKVQLMTFGQPRVGNAVFASYFAEYVPNTIRLVHAHDIVPHLPPYFSFLSKLTYHHFPREVWINDSEDNTTEQICDSSGEDPNCCRCLSILSLSIQDHFTYLGVDMEADDWSTCRIIRAQSVEQLRKDLASNIIMAKHNVDVSIVENGVQTDWSSSR